MKKNLKLILLILILLIALGLRFYHLNSNPPSPYWEEAAIGYDAYSILKTGKDFHGHKFPLVAFESFGDYKPGLYFYAAVPSVALFGLNSFAVRFPSAFFGTLTVLLIYWLTKLLVNNDLAALSASFLLAISPWHLQVSRAGFEANLGLFLVALAACLFLKGLKQSKYLFLSVFSFALSLYAYHANRVFVPLLGLAFGLMYLNFLKKKKKIVLFSLALFFAIISPLLIVLKSPQMTQRFLETSALTSLEPIIKSNQLIQEDGNTWLAKIVHHRFWQYSNIILGHYLDHFNFDFLFLSGDNNPRHSIQLVGELYLVQLPLFLLGLYYIFKQKPISFLPLILWLVIAPIPAALTTATPHVLRSLPLVIPFSIISALGLLQLIKLKFWRYLMVILGAGLIFELSRYLYIYHLDYPRVYSSHWQYGYQSAVSYINENFSQYDHIYFTRELGRPSIYYWFYSRTDPAEVQAANNVVSKDQGEYLEYGKLNFQLAHNQQFPAKSLIIAGPGDILAATFIKSIKALDGRIIFNLYQN
jgi:4-amino-4-deoxy-L-arabinose transferase-like glycosyltransferase